MTSDYQFSFNGVSFGVGTNIQVLQSSGLEDLPTVRSNDVNRPRDTGEFIGLDFSGGRDVTVDLLLLDTAGAADLYTTIQALQTATVPIQSGTLPLTFQVPGRINRQVNARPRRRSIPVNVDYSVRYVKASVEFHCADPRIYDVNISTLALNLPVVSGGLSWPLHWPLSWGTATSGAGTATNAGNVNTRAVVTFAGPLTAPSIKNATTGQTWACSAVLNNGDSLVVDFDQKTVLLNGTASRYSTIATGSVWWEIVPGANSIIYSASAGTGTATVAYRSAWL